MSSLSYCTIPIPGFQVITLTLPPIMLLIDHIGCNNIISSKEIRKVFGWFTGVEVESNTTKLIASTNTT